MEQHSYDRIYMIWIARTGSIGPRLVCYWNISEVKDGKLKIHYERENKGKPVKQCKLSSQGKKSKQKEEKYKNTNTIRCKNNEIIIIIQIYNNLQGLWSTRVKFVSLCQSLG